MTVHAITPTFTLSAPRPLTPYEVGVVRQALARYGERGAIEAARLIAAQAPHYGPVVAPEHPGIAATEAE